MKRQIIIVPNVNKGDILKSKCAFMIVQISFIKIILIIPVKITLRGVKYAQMEQKRVVKIVWMETLS